MVSDDVVVAAQGLNVEFCAQSAKALPVGSPFRDDSETFSVAPMIQDDASVSTFSLAECLSSMNNAIKDLDQADLDQLTTFFNPKRQSEWAGPDHWKYKKSRRESVIRSVKKEKVW